MEQPNIDLTPDTGAQENTPPHPDDPHQTTSGSSQSPGGKNAPAQSASDLTHGQEGYPGPRAGGETDKPSDPPVAGDTDPGSTASADETGQAGDLSATQQDPQKNKGNAWNG